MPRGERLHLTHCGLPTPKGSCSSKEISEHISVCLPVLQMMWCMQMRVTVL